MINTIQISPDIYKSNGKSFSFKSSIRLISHKMHLQLYIHLMITTHNHFVYLIYIYVPFSQLKRYHTFLPSSYVLRGVVLTHLASFISSIMHNTPSNAISHNKHLIPWSYYKNKAFCTRSHNKYEAFSSHKVQKIIISLFQFILSFIH